MVAFYVPGELDFKLCGEYSSILNWGNVRAPVMLNINTPLSSVLNINTPLEITLYLT